jgi:hypothetical protein
LLLLDEEQNKSMMQNLLNCPLKFSICAALDLFGEEGEGEGPVGLVSTRLN